MEEYKKQAIQILEKLRTAESETDFNSFKNEQRTLFKNIRKDRTLNNTQKKRLNTMYLEAINNI